MVYDTMGVIYTGDRHDRSNRMQELTALRSLAAMPVGGRYRMIDFLLSGMVNHGIRNVGVITEKNYHSLMDHLGSGKEWDLHTKRGGLFLLPPFMSSDKGAFYDAVYTGLLDALRTNLSYLRRSQQKYVVVMMAQHIFNVDYAEALDAHVASGTDITMLYRKYSDSDLDPQSEQAFIDVSGNGRVSDIECSPRTPSYANMYMDAFIIERQLLYALLDNASAHGYMDFTRDILQRGVQDKTLVLGGFEVKGYVRCIESVQSYYDFNMDLLTDEYRRELFGSHPIYTKVRDDIPAMYGANAKCANSLVADGCIIEGQVENSVLFRGVHVLKGATVRNSIIMQDSEVQESAQVENIITDKQVVIRRGRRIISTQNFPIVIAKGAVI